MLFFGKYIDSGCPVIEGQKLIITQWMRYGVDNENPWDSFNTLGVKVTSEEENDIDDEEEEGEEL